MGVAFGGAAREGGPKEGFNGRVGSHSQGIAAIVMMMRMVVVVVAAAAAAAVLLFLLGGGSRLAFGRFTRCRPRFGAAPLGRCAIL